MSTDLVSWLRAALDDEERDTDVHYVVCASLPDDPDHTAHGMGPQECDCGEPEQLVRTVAAHRAILEWVVERQQPGSTVGDDYLYPLYVLATIYESRPGFDPSWRADP